MTKKVQLNKYFENTTGNTQASNKRINFIIRIFHEMLMPKEYYKSERRWGMNEPNKKFSVYSPSAPKASEVSLL